MLTIHLLSFLHLYMLHFFFIRRFAFFHLGSGSSFWNCNIASWLSVIMQSSDSNMLALLDCFSFLPKVWSSFAFCYTVPAWPHVFVWERWCPHERWHLLVWLCLLPLLLTILHSPFPLLPAFFLVYFQHLSSSVWLDRISCWIYLPPLEFVVVWLVPHGTSTIFQCRVYVLSHMLVIFHEGCSCWYKGTYKHTWALTHVETDHCMRFQLPLTQKIVMVKKAQNVSCRRRWKWACTETQWWT